MKLDVKRTLTGGLFSVDIIFKDYEIFEEGLIEDFGAPRLKIEASNWSATASAGTGGASITLGEPKKDHTGNCKISINKEIDLAIDSTFKVSYAIQLSDIEKGEVTTAPLDSVVKLAEAKCMLFVKVIQTEAAKKMTELRAMKTDFEAVVSNPETIKI